MPIATPDWFDKAMDDDGDARASCVTALTDYFHADDGVPAYSGSRFESFGDNPPHRIIVDDLVAVSMLSVDVPGQAALRFLERSAGHISELLTRIPTDLDLHDDADASHIAKHSPAWSLWDVLRTQPKSSTDRVGVGEVRTSKLLARKRPRLLPVYDRIVRDQLGLKSSLTHWDDLHSFLTEEKARVAFLQQLRTEATVPPHVSVLRVFDVLLWMHGKNPQERRAQEDPSSE